VNVDLKINMSQNLIICLKCIAELPQQNTVMHQTPHFESISRVKTVIDYLAVSRTKHTNTMLHNENKLTRLPMYQSSQQL
jgi:hypothetical protein